MLKTTNIMLYSLVLATTAANWQKHSLFACKLRLNDDYLFINLKLAILTYYMNTNLNVLPQPNPTNIIIVW